MTLKHVVVALSGGIDSAVAAHLLKVKGHQVTGVFFKCWDELEERGACSGNADARDASRIADHLRIGFKEVDYVKQYWHHVLWWVWLGFFGVLIV